MKKIAFVLACILTISICLAGCQETEFDTGEGTPVFSLDANEISAVTFQNGNTGEKTIVSNRDEITEIADYLNAFRYTETQSVRGGDGWSSRIIIDFNEGESISFYSLEAGKIIMDDTEYILTSSEEGKVFDLEYNVRTLLLILWNERTTSKSEDTTLARKQPLPPGEPAGSGGKPQRPAAPAIPRGSAQKHFHTASPEGAAV